MPKLKQPKTEKTPQADRIRTETGPRVEIRWGDNPLTIPELKEMIGWEEVAERDDTCSPEATQLFGRPIRLTKNRKNRPITVSWVLGLKQKHLQKQWEENNTSIGIGEHGNVMDGQHCILSALLAEEERVGPKAAHWEVNWPGPITMAKLVVYGLKEDDKTFASINQSKPNTVAEILYRSEHFARMSPAGRKKCGRMVETAITLLWHRTGACNDAFAPRCNPEEAMLFLERHPTLKECVKDVYEEDRGSGTKGGKGATDGAPGQLSKYLRSAGYTAALYYLMAASDSDGDSYWTAEVRDESKMDLGLKDRAWEYLVLLRTTEDPTLAPVRRALGELFDPDTGVDRGSLQDRLAILIKGWNLFSRRQPVAEDDLRLDRRENIHGVMKLVECPDAGGIDLGDPTDRFRNMRELAEKEKDYRDPTPEEIAVTKKQVEAEREVERLRKHEEHKRKLMERKERARKGDQGTEPLPDEE